MTERLQRTLDKTRQNWDPHFVWVVNETTPWTTFAKPLNEARLTLVSTCGAFDHTVHARFDAANFTGDCGFRVIHRHTPLKDLSFAHDHYDHAYVNQDANVGFPLERLKALAQEGVIGGLTAGHFSFMGYITQPRRLIQETAPRVAQMIREENADAALLVPC